jgi:superfamily II DNA or RNA helicase
VKHELLKGARIQLNQKEQEQLTQFSTLAKTALKRVDEDEERTKRLVEHIAGLNPEWPVLVFTASVLSAQVLAALLKTQGIPAASVSGETPKNQRRRVIEQFRKGEIRVLTNCEVLTEGFDAPHVRALYIARPTLSPNAYIQMAGRGLRGPLNGGSSECLIVDLEDSISNMGRDLAYREFVDLWQGA